MVALSIILYLFPDIAIGYRVMAQICYQYSMGHVTQVIHLCLFLIVEDILSLRQMFFDCGCRGAALGIFRSRSLTDVCNINNFASTPL